MSLFRFKECFHVETVDNQIFLFSEKEHHLLRGEIYALLAPLLKEGIYTEDQLIEKLALSASLPEIYYGLERLNKAGYLAIGSSSQSKEISACCQLLGVSVESASLALKNQSISLHSTSGIDINPLHELLRQMEIRVVNENPHLHVFLVQDYLEESLEKWLAQIQTPFLLIKPVGCQIWVGPLLEKHQSACYECLAERLKRNRLEEGYVQHKKGITQPFPISVAALPASRHFAFDLAALEIFKWIVKEGDSPLKNKMISFDVVSLKMQEHPVAKLERCTHCGRTDTPSSKPFMIERQKKGEYRDGGYRSHPPEYTLSKFENLVSPITGIVKKLAQAEEKKIESPIHVYHAGHNFALSNQLNGIYKNSYRSSSCGKGRSQAQAKTSALCEAIERYCGVYHKDVPKISAAFQEIKSQAVHPKDIMLFSAHQYEKRATTNPLAIACHFVPDPFCETSKIDWTPVWSLTEEKEKFLPSAYCYYGYPYEKGGEFIRGDSNGCAAGNTLAEAFLQGFFELVERDAVAIWWYNRVQRPSVDLKSFNDPFFDALCREYEKLGRKIWAIDLTNDLGIPTFAAFSSHLGKEILMGFGTHLNPKIALERALTEVNQLLDFHKLSKEAAYVEQDERVCTDWFAWATMENQPYLKGVGNKTAADYSYAETSDFVDDVQICRQIIESRGMEILALDQTHADIGLKVVRVIVPGLRHFWPRFAKGRLYDVPVKLGWVEHPLTEQELNPIPMFL